MGLGGAGRTAGSGEPEGGPEGLWSGNQPQLPDIGGYGNHEYGNRVGIFRILAAAGLRSAKYQSNRGSKEASFR